MFIPVLNIHKNVNQQNNNLKSVIKPNIRENFKEFCKNTTFHGLRFVGDGKISWFERIFFGISFLSLLCISTIFISDVYQQWNSTPVIVSISSTTTFINQIPFPAVTICNMNQASAKKVKNITKNSLEYEMLELLCHQENVNTNNISNITNWELFGDFILKVGQRCADMLVYCQFGGTISKCLNYFRTVLTDEGLCCTFNAVHSSFIYAHSNKNISTYKDYYENDAVPIDWNPEKGYPDTLPKSFYPRIGAVRGLTEGLFIILDAEIKDYYCSSTNGAGFKIAVHSPVETPNLKNSLIIPVGMQSRIRITPQIIEASNTIKDLRIRERQCLFNSENFLKTFTTYSQSNCELESYANLMIENCNCIPYYLTKIHSNIRICGIKDIKCLENNDIKLKEFNNKSENYINMNCYQSCFHLSYQAALFGSAINSSGKYNIKDEIVQNRTDEYNSNNTVVLQFFYQYNAFRGNHKNEFIGTTEFLSNTGGLMGLFLGFSFLSIVEIFYYASFRPYCAHCRYKKAITNSKNNDKIKMPSTIQYKHVKVADVQIKNKMNNYNNSANLQYFN